MQRLLLDEWQDQHAPTVHWLAVLIRNVGGRERLVSVVIIVESDPNLFQVVVALCPSRRFTGCLYRGQQQGSQNATARKHAHEARHRDDADGRARAGTLNGWL